MPFISTGPTGYLPYFIQDILPSRICKDTEVYLDKTTVYTEKGVDQENSGVEILEILMKSKFLLKLEKFKSLRSKG